MNVIPSRDTINRYNEMKRSIEEQVSTINGKYSTLHWQPIIYRYNHLSFEELCALYQAADAALITPLRDGMNLVAKEYVASCIDKGVLILSELTGAASELNEALLVNPTDSEEVAEAIYQAMTMPLIEQRSRLSYLQRRTAEYDVHKWINDFTDQLIITKKDQEVLKVDILTDAHINKVLDDFQKASKRCPLDYDGTLAPYEKMPSMAAPSEELMQLLAGLTLRSRKRNRHHKWKRCRHFAKMARRLTPEHDRRTWRQSEIQEWNVGTANTGEHGLERAGASTDAIVCRQVRRFIH